MIALDPARGWRVLCRFAGRHAGYFTTRQALRTGCTERVRAGIGDGSILVAGSGILRLAGWPTGPLDECAMWAAWFDGTVAVSHHSAADLHGFGQLHPRFLHLSTPMGRPPAVSRVVVWPRRLSGGDLESAGTFLLTTGLRTVLDLAESEIAQSAVDEVVSDALTLGRCQAAELQAAAESLAPWTAIRVRRALAAA